MLVIASNFFQKKNYHQYPEVNPKALMVAISISWSRLNSTACKIIFSDTL